jgi:hypothetical protein
MSSSNNEEKNSHNLYEGDNLNDLLNSPHVKEGDYIHYISYNQLGQESFTVQKDEDGNKIAILIQNDN